MYRSALFRRAGWAGLAGAALDQLLSTHGLLATLLPLLAPLTVAFAREEEEHTAMSLAGLGALAGSLLVVAPALVWDAAAGLTAHAAVGSTGHAAATATMIVMGASMGGMLGGGWQYWRLRR
ncbi:MAG: hypothetical protein IMW98_05990 [Firmicutes bacterium]|nr:hypothetical protein [Bacillota bacterium]